MKMVKRPINKNWLLESILIGTILISVSGCTDNDTVDDNIISSNLPHTVNYLSTVGGTVWGEHEQTTDNASYVVAVADEGFSFKEWSDGSKDETRIINSADSDISLTAEFTQKYTDIPMISITTEEHAPVSSKETYVSCSVTVSDPENDINNGVFSAVIRGRGNASWGFDKKSYKIKFDKKVNLLSTGNSKQKDWTLISCHGDQSMLRNYVALSLGDKLDGIEWSSGCSFCEVYLNDAYVGVYMVCEQIEAKPGRIELSTSESEDEKSEYLVELDMYAGGEKFVDYIIVGDKPYSIKSDVTPDEGKYIYDVLSAADRAVSGGDEAEVNKYIDVKSLIDMYLLQEYTKNIDVGWSSLYMTIKNDGKVHYTAPWDFDLSLGNDGRLDNGSYNQTYAATGRDGFSQNNTWFINLWKQMWFRKVAAARWYEISDCIDNLETETKKMGDYLTPAMERNYDRWKIISSRTHQQPSDVLKCTTYTAHVDYLISWMNSRQDYLNRMFEQYK